MQIKLDDRTVRSLKPKAKRFDVSDRDNPGFWLRVSPSGVKSFAMMMRGSDGKLKRVTLGRYDSNAAMPSDPNCADAYGDRLSLAGARRKATLIRAQIAAGGDPVAEKRARRDAAIESAANIVPLKQLIAEYADGPGKSLKTWRSGEAPSRIGLVFAPLLERDVREITATDFADAMANYAPKSGKVSANGQISRARAYLAPVLNWATGRRSFAKIGAHRRPRIEAASLSETHDPATSDNAIRGARDRVLREDELAALLPALDQVTETRAGVRRGDPVSTTGLRTLHGPAMKFILLTACRLGELTAMRWEHIDFDRAEWFKPTVKSTRGGLRSQTLPLSDAAIDLLRSLPTYPDHRPDSIVFASETGGELMNWRRATARLSSITGVTGWHRHDLRRTSATIMEAIGVAPRVIEQILAHKNPLKAEGIGGAASAYIRLGQRFGGAEDPQRRALNRLAQALAVIEERPTAGNVVLYLSNDDS